MVGKSVFVRSASSTERPKDVFPDPRLQFVDTDA